jgi:hypothetical protein
MAVASNMPIQMKTALAVHLAQHHDGSPFQSRAMASTLSQRSSTAGSHGALPADGAAAEGRSHRVAGGRARSIEGRGPGVPRSIRTAGDPDRESGVGGRESGRARHSAVGRGRTAGRARRPTFALTRAGGNTNMDRCSGAVPVGLRQASALAFFVLQRGVGTRQVCSPARMAASRADRPRLPGFAMVAWWQRAPRYLLDRRWGTTPG